MERPEQPALGVQILRHPGLGDEPDRLGLELRLRQVELDQVERGLIVDRLLLVRDDLLGDDDRSEAELEPQAPFIAPLLVDRRHQLLLHLRVVVARERLDECRPRFQVQRDDPVLRSEVHVDRALVHRRVRALLLD